MNGRGGAQRYWSASVSTVRPKLRRSEQTEPRATAEEPEPPDPSDPGAQWLPVALLEREALVDDLRIAWSAAMEGRGSLFFREERPALGRRRSSISSCEGSTTVAASSRVHAIRSRHQSLSGRSSNWRPCSAQKWLTSRPGPRLPGSCSAWSRKGLMPFPPSWCSRTFIGPTESQEQPRPSAAWCWGCSFARRP